MSAPRPVLRSVGLVGRVFARWQSTTTTTTTYAHLDAEMRRRKIRPIFDDLTPLHSFRLNVSLAAFLPNATAPSLLAPSDASEPLLPKHHHLLYFEPSLPAPALLPDGTNPAHSPGHPFHRRMWAGGSVRYNLANPLKLNGGRAVCVEGIRRATVKGRPGEEKVFVAIERRMGYLSVSERRILAGLHEADEAAIAGFEDEVRQRLWRDDEDTMGEETGVLETRNIVFLQEGKPGGKDEGEAAAESKPRILRPGREASLFRHAITPDPRLLFRFSALTFNAHAIHLDPLFCREKEGHRDLLFHGPLSFTFLMELVGRNLPRGEEIGYVEYRNLAPLYCNEQVRFCGAEDGPGRYEVWAEGPDGGVKVKGSVRTRRS